MPTQYVKAWGSNHQVSDQALCTPLTLGCVTPIFIWYHAVAFSRCHLLLTANAAGSSAVLEPRIPSVRTLWNGEERPGECATPRGPASRHSFSSSLEAALGQTWVQSRNVPSPLQRKRVLLTSGPTSAARSDFDSTSRTYETGSRPSLQEWNCGSRDSWGLKWI